ncbi:Tetratricopeptide repeat-containing protein [Novosphingobium sp. CF614]|uniref:tetratricopeptide repeat protein n=1 Tax=Novosphingobium sp. CF614 TaxID=1884364 RepID=UPI0008F05CDC|nr:tetratricopeptide repeat protein [Novosphingobium sp. CF614]SFF84088.1 Tetratricopeptide repeat-containing protein [Novosphingobium sp. CF614]
MAALALPLALLSSPVVGQRPQGEALIGKTLIGEARAALARGDGIDGEMKLRAALESGTARNQVAAFMGQAYLAQDDRERAREWLASGDFSRASAAEGWRALGLLERLDGNLPASGRAYDKALALIPRDASLWVEIGRLRYAGGEHGLAIAAAEHALALEPDNVRALEFGGQLVRDRYGLMAAIPWFEQAIMRDPKDVSVLLEYAATLGELGRASEALTVTRRVLELSPKNPRAYYLQAVIAARAGNYELARGLLARTGGKLDREAGVQMLRGVVEIAAGNPSAAAEALEAVLRAKPDCRQAKDLLARAIYLGGEYRYVALRFSGDLAHDDASPYLLTVVARSYEALGERQRAGELLDRAAHAQVPPLRVVPGQGAIGALLAGGQGAAAQAQAEAARGTDPGFYDAQALAGDVQLALGNARAAQARYAAAAEIRMPESLFRRRFEAFAMAGDLRGGEELVEGYLLQNPTSRPALRAAAWLAIGTGDAVRAQAILSWLRDNGDGRDVQLLSDLAMVQASEGDFEAARDSALAAYRLQRASPLATQALAYSYVALGIRRAEAGALLDKAQTLVGNTPLIAEAREQLRARRRG